MSCCDQCACDPCACHFSFTDPTKLNQAGTLAGSLVGLVDSVRDLYACLGARAYSVHLVRTRWSGGERGVGVEEVISEMQILPVPRVTGLDGIDRSAQPVGMVEQGTIRIDQISARYTEDQLTGIEKGRALPLDQQFYWEIRSLELGGQPVQRRRMTPSSSPQLDRLNMQWTMRFARQQADRGRAGDPR